MFGYVKGRCICLLIIIVLPLLVAGCVEGQIMTDEAATRQDEREGAGQAPAGPNEQEAEMIEVYANAERLLDPFVGRPVSVEGKLVDLSDEGYGIELWIAAIDTSGFGD
jgi:hypothetical protein